MTRRTSAVGRYATGERDLVWTSHDHTGGGPLIVVAHGFFAGPTNYLPGGARRTMDLLADAGCVVVAADLGGASTWATDEALERVHDLINWARLTYGADTSRVAFIGDSMGGMLALNWAWRNTAQFACASLRVPVVLADALHDRDPSGIGAAIDTAYGGPAAWDAAKATRDPIANAAAITEIADDIRIWHSTDDPVVLPADIATFTAATGVQAHPLGDVQHDEDLIYAAVPATYEAQWILSRVAANKAPTHATAVAEQERWLTYMRNPVAPAGYRGGDVTDAVTLPDGRIAWIGADWFSGSVDPDDTFASALPFRNGLLLEQAGAFIGQVFASGTSGEWLIPNQVEHPGSHYWPIAALVEGDTLQVGCWLVVAGGPYGDLVDSHIVSVDLTDLRTITAVTKMALATETFFVDGLVDGGDGYTYIFGEEFVPQYGPFVPAYGDNPDTDITRKRVARCPAGTLTALAGWRYWDGTDWSASLADAVPLADADTGQPIEGDAGVCQVNGGWLLAAHQLVDDNIRVWTAHRPQGPWTAADPVPVPDMGGTWYWGQRIGQLLKLLPDRPAPTGHVTAVVSMNLINDPTSTLGLRDIRTVAPRFEAIPIP